MGGIPGIVPGQMAFGHSSALAGAPSITGGILIIDSSSLGNLKPASLKAFPKSFSLGKSIWQVLQLVPYMRENAGIAKLLLADRIVAARASNSRDSRTVRTVCRCMSVLLDPIANRSEEHTCELQSPCNLVC